MTSLSVRRIRALAAVAALGVLLAGWLASSAAFGFGPPVSGDPFAAYSCDRCHSVTSAGGTSNWTKSGPHGSYSVTTQKCGVCHQVHNAPAAGVVLLRGPTVSASCLMCHDGTQSEIGPYHSIVKRGGSVRAEHSTDSTSTVPGASANLTADLSCAHCHSVHGANLVQPFIRDSGRAFSSDELVTSACLLRSDLLGTAPGTYPEYSSLWCAACHDQRHSNAAPMTLSHPVSTSATWGYGDVRTTVTAGSWRTENGGAGFALGMGRTNAAYTMPPVPESGDGRVTVAAAPLCQQCHEDARQVEAVFDGDYTGRGTDPWNQGVNVPFLTFPHQATNEYFRVENGDDLCLNCHSASELP